MADWRWDSNLEYWLRRTQQQYAQALNHILETQFGLSERYWPVLQALFVEQGIQQTTIGEHTGEPNYQISRVIDRLEALGLVERRSDPMNHRARLVYLTHAGEQLREPLHKALSALHQLWLEDAGKDEATLRQIFTVWLSGSKPASDSKRDPATPPK